MTRGLRAAGHHTELSLADYFRANKMSSRP